jgi:hypothetical protein
VLPAAKFQFAQRRGVKRIGTEAIAVANRTDLFEPALGTFVLRDRDGTVGLCVWTVYYGLLLTLENLAPLLPAHSRGSSGNPCLRVL